MRSLTGSRPLLLPMLPGSPAIHHCHHDHHALGCGKQVCWCTTSSGKVEHSSLLKRAPAKWCTSDYPSRTQIRSPKDFLTMGFCVASEEEIDEKRQMASERASGAHAEQQRLQK